jgi:hypothetical protein
MALKSLEAPFLKKRKRNRVGLLGRVRKSLTKRGVLWKREKEETKRHLRLTKREPRSRKLTISLLMKLRLMSMPQAQCQTHLENIAQFVS